MTPVKGYRYCQLNHSLSGETGVAFILRHLFGQTRTKTAFSFCYSCKWISLRSTMALIRKRTMRLGFLGTFVYLLFVYVLLWSGYTGRPLFIKTDPQQYLPHGNFLSVTQAQQRVTAVRTTAKSTEICMYNTGHHVMHQTYCQLEFLL